jgi:PAS domain S-box-containing protein
MVWLAHVRAAPLAMKPIAFSSALVGGTQEAVEERFRSLFDAAPDAMVIVDREGTIRLVNSEFEAVFGWSRAEIVGRPLETLVPERYRLAHQDHHRDYFGQPHVRPIRSGLQLYGRRRDGGEFPAEISLSPFRTSEGTWVIASVRDVSERQRTAELARHAAALQLEVTERRRIQQELAESERRLRDAQRIGDIGSWEWDVTRDRAVWSEHLYAIFGVDPSTPPSYQAYLDLVLPQDLAAVQAAVEEALASGGAGEYLVRIRRPDGEVRILHNRVQLVRDENGRPQRLSGTTLEVTERERAKQDLEERARLAALGADVGRALVEGDELPATLQRCAEAIVRGTGAAFARIWTLAEGASVLELRASAGVYTRLDGSHSRVSVGAKKIGRIAATRAPHLTNAVLNDPFVDREWARLQGMVAFAGYPLIVADRLVGVVALFARAALSDFTVAALASVADEIALGIERVRVEAVRRTRDERFRELAGSIREIFWLASADFREFIYVSPAYAQIWGRDPEDLYSRPREWQEGVLPEDRQRVREFVSRLVEREGEVEFRVCQPGGAVRWVAARGWPVRDAQDRVYRIAGVAEDITQRRSLEEQFRQAQKLEAVGRLAGGVAHDFNNLLTAINGYSELALRQVEASSPLRSPLEEVQRAGQRAADLTRQLLAFSRRQVLQPKVLDLNALIAGTEKMLRRLIGEDVELAMAAAPTLGRVFADPGQLEQVVMNLVLNARDAMPAGGTITLETADVELPAAAAESIGVPPGPYVTLRVLDTGHGMDAETQARIFEPFFTTKEAGKGTGLGLSMVYGIVRQSDGAILCHSEPGSGTSFSIYLPRAAALVETQASAAADSPGGRERILLVEDEAAVREITRELLEASGYTVLVASGAQQALALAAEASCPPDLLLSDIVLPGLSGPQLAERLCASEPGLRVLFISGYAAETLGTHLPAGVDLLPKPFTRAALLRRVREALDR